jgi:hypothetical protein
MERSECVFIGSARGLLVLAVHAGCFLRLADRGDNRQEAASSFGASLKAWAALSDIGLRCLSQSFP